MITRAAITIAVLLFGIYAFWSGAVDGSHVLNPFGIMCLLLAALFWFAWKSISQAFKTVKDESDIPILRMGSTIIKGMENHAERPARSSPEP